MLKKLFAIVVVIPMASSPMLTSFQQTRPLAASVVRAYQLPQRAHASSRALSALAEQVATYKKLHHELTEKEKQLAEACKTQDTYQSAKYFTCVFFTMRLFGDLQWGSGMGCVMDIVDGGILAGMFHCAEPHEHISVLEKDRTRLITALDRSKVNIKQKMELIKQDACDERNHDLYDSMQIIRTTMELEKP